MKKKKPRIKINKKALLTALALSIGAAQASPNSLFNLIEFGSYSASDVLAGCGVGSCGSTSAPVQRGTDNNDDDDEDEAINNDDPATLNECKQECKDEFPGKSNKKDRKGCIKDCKEQFE